MEIGKQIKEKRSDLNMTQEDLAKKLNVARSTISNWEIGRNYPDLQLIVKISEILNIPLDVLLRKDSSIVNEITKDTKLRKNQSRKIRILCVIIILFVLIGVVSIYRNNEYKDITSPEQIVEVKVSGTQQIEVIADLPSYRSISGYMINNFQEGSDNIEVSLYSQIDLTMKNKETILIDISDLEENISISNIKTVEFVSNNGPFKSFDLQ